MFRIGSIWFAGLFVFQIISVNAAPTIRFKVSTHDFGVSIDQTELKHRFEFKNEGDALLVINEVKASCGCTAAVATTKEIQPGESGAIDVVYKPGKTIGPSSKTITVLSNDPSSPQTTLTIKATIETWLSAQPDRLYFGRIQRKEQKNQPLHLIGKDLGSLQIKSIRIQDKPPLDPAQTSTIAQSLRAGVTWKTNELQNQDPPVIEITVSIDAALLNPGLYQDTLIIETNSKNNPRLELPLTCEILGNITLTPSRVLFQISESQANSSVNVLIKASDAFPFEIRKLVSSDPRITVRQTTKGAQAEHSLDVTLADSVTENRLTASITIETDSRDQPTINLPVSVFRASGKAGPSSHGVTGSLAPSSDSESRR